MAKLYDKEDVTDAYVEVRLGKGHLARTSVIQDDLNPKFYEDFRVKVCHFANEITFEVRDEDHLSKYSFTNPKYYKKIIFMLKVLSSLAMWKFLPKNYFKVMPLKDGLISKARMVNLTVNSN